MKNRGNKPKSPGSGKPPHRDALKGHTRGERKPGRGKGRVETEDWPDLEVRLEDFPDMAINLEDFNLEFPDYEMPEIDWDFPESDWNLEEIKWDFNDPEPPGEEGKG